jgi:transposase
VVSVQGWAEIRRMRFVEGLSIREIHRRTGRHRETIRAALRSSKPPSYSRPPRPSLLDPHKDEIHRLLHDDPRLQGQRVRELLCEQGYPGGKTILDDYLREVRPLFLAPRSYQRTSYRPGELFQFDLWQPSRPIPVGYGQLRESYVVVGALGYSRFGAGALIFSKQAPDILWGLRSRSVSAWPATGCASQPPPSGSPAWPRPSASGASQTSYEHSPASR